MWTRAELKERAKANLRKYYWMAFVVSLIYGLVSGFGGGGSNPSMDSSSYYSSSGTDLAEGLPGAVGQIPETIGQVPGGMATIPVAGGSSAVSAVGLISGLFLGVAVFLVILAIVLSIFVVPAMEVGKNRFYMESRGLGASAGIGKLLWGFSHHYLNIVLTMFLRNLFIVLGFILCVIPGIYLTYCYYMVPYILAENPDMKPMEALSLSKDMMNGHKLNTWILELSFLGWWILGVLACCIGTFFVQPYYDATIAELYAVLRRPHGSRLAGFGVPDVAPAGEFTDYTYTQGGYYGGNGQGGYGPNGDYGQGGYGQESYGQNGGWGQDRVNGGWSQTGTYGSGNGGEYGPGGGGPNSENGYSGGGSWQRPGDGSENGGRDFEVDRSEGGPGKGYYLNGEFHPYSDDDKKN